MANGRYALGVAAILALSLGTGGACNNGGPLTFEIHDHTSTVDTLLFGVNRNTGGTFTFGEPEVGLAPLFALQVGTRIQPIDVRLEADGDTLAAQQEAHVFARDPEETFQTLSGIMDDAATWDFNTRGPAFPTVTLPYDVVVPYPIVDGQVGPTILRPASKTDFWGSGTPDGPGAVPIGVGSIKAARIVQLGLCSTMFPMSKVVPPLVSDVGVGFIQNACDFNASPDLETFEGYVPTLMPTRYYMHGASFLRHEVGSPADQNGGFILHGKLNMDSNLFVLGSCEMVFNTHYQFILNNGILAILVDGDSVFQTFSSSIMCDVIGNMTHDSLLDPTNTKGIVLGLDNMASGMQVFPQNDDGNDPLFNCVPDVPSGTATARAELEAAIRSGAAAKGVGSTDIDSLVAAANALDSDGNPLNWRCTKFNIPQHCDGSTLVPERVNRAQFIVRAKRINVFPDAVELIWFDSTTEFDNPTLALYYASFANIPGQPAPDPNAFKQLCSRAPDVVGQTFPGDLSKNFYNRSFVTSHLPFSNTCPVNPLPPPPPTCFPCSPTASNGFPLCPAGCVATNCP